MITASELGLMKLEVEFNKKPTRYQCWLAELGINVYLGHYKRDGWKGELPFYLFECPIHGLVYNYPQGYNQRLECPICREEAQR